MTSPAAHKWAFAPRFRRHALGWRSQPALQRVREAVAEIRKVANKDPTLAAAGAVLFLETKGIPFSAQNGMLARLAPMHRDIISKD